MSMPTPPGTPGDPNNPGGPGNPGNPGAPGPRCPGCAGAGGPSFPGFPGPPSFPRGPGLLDFLSSKVDKIVPLIAVASGLFRDAADVVVPLFGGDSDEVRLEAEVVRSRHTLKVLKRVDHMYSKAAFYETSGAKHVAETMLRQIGEVLGEVERGRVADERGEAARARERLDLLAQSDAADAAAARTERKPKPPRKAKPKA